MVNSENKGTVEKSWRNYLAMLLRFICYQNDFKFAEDLPRSNSYGTESKADVMVISRRHACYACLCSNGSEINFHHVDSASGD